MTVTIIETPVSSEELPTSETPAPAAVAEAIVEVAQIEADRDVAIAEIHAETTEALIEAEAEEGADETDLTLEGIAECQQNIGILSEKVETLTALISERLPPAPSPPLEPNPEEKSADAHPEAETEVPPAPPPPKTKKSRWI